MSNHNVSRRDAVRTLGLGAAFGAVHQTRSRSAQAQPVKRPPNILYLHSHDTGRHIGPYGHDMPTPHLARLAGDGVLFRNNFCANPTCSASRSCLLTGQSAHANGMTGLAHRGFRLNDYRSHIIHTLKPSGYTAVLAGIQHVASGEDPWKTIGYDRFLGAHDVAHERACEYLDSKPDRPFFLSVGFFETHREFAEPGPEDDPRYILPAPTVPDTPETRLDMARFRTSVRILDRKMGMVLEALERNNLDGDTLVICTTDHGIAFPRMKCNLTDGGIGVMLIMRGPGGFNGGKVVDSIVSHVDIFPTICDLTGIQRPDRLEGTSLLPLVNGGADDIREEVFAEVNYHAAYEPMRCVRTKRWKYIRRYDGRSRPVLPNCDDGPSKTVWLRHGWADQPVPEEALYDLVFDPSETRNLVDESSLGDVLADMRGRLGRWMRDTDDPLLRGMVPAPKGAQINDPDGISPREKPVTIE